MVTILQGDCREILKTLPDGSVNCCVTSPPYFGLRDYGVDGQIARTTLTRTWRRWSPSSARCGACFAMTGRCGWVGDSYLEVVNPAGNLGKMQREIKQTSGIVPMASNPDSSAFRGL